MPGGSAAPESTARAPNHASRSVNAERTDDVIHTLFTTLAFLMALVGLVAMVVAWISGARFSWLNAVELVSKNGLTEEQETATRAAKRRFLKALVTATIAMLCAVATTLLRDYLVGQ